jgi:PAS domain S-box-containing protein
VTDDDAHQQHARLVGRNIALGRQLAKLSQRQLARHLEVRQRQLSDWERGVHQPSPRNLGIIAKTLGRPATWFHHDHGDEGAKLAQSLVVGPPLSRSAIITMTDEWVITGWNQPAVELFGYKVSEAIGANGLDLLPEDGGREARLAALKRDGWYTAHSTTQRKDGTLVEVEAVVFEVTDGPLLSCIAVIHSAEET